MNLEAATICFLPKSNFTFFGDTYENQSFYYVRRFRLRRTKLGKLIWSEHFAATYFGVRYDSYEEALAAARNEGLIQLKRKNSDAIFYYFKEGDLGP